MKSLKYAPDAFKCLNGLFCIYKPVGIASIAVRNTICFNLCRDLNELIPREIDDVVSLKGSVCSNKPFEVEFSPNISQHKLVSGPYYQPQDIRMKYVSCLGCQTSGIMLMAVNDGCKLLNNVYNSYLRKYIIEGKFGLATNDFMLTGKVSERSSFSHVKQPSLDKLLSSIQASHQSMIFDYLGVDIQSQGAYDLAAKGLVKLSTKSKPILYKLKCTEFKLPHFTLELQCINETEDFLAELIHDIGIDLKTNAVCKRLRRTQLGHFTPSHALLRKHWNLTNIINNIALCDAMLEDSDESQLIRKQKQRSFIQLMQSKVREEELL